MTSISHHHNLISVNPDPPVNLSHYPLQHHYNSAHTGDLPPKDNSNYKSYNSSQASSSLSTDSQDNKTISDISQNKRPRSWKKKRFKKVISNHDESSTHKEYENEAQVHIVAPSSTNIHLLDNNTKSFSNKQGITSKIYEELTDDDNSENDNESTCNECHGGGELVCCDGCVKAYHSDCLTPSKRPRIDSQTDWYCPDCQFNLSLIRKSKNNFPNGQNCSTSISASPISQAIPVAPQPPANLPPTDYDFTNTETRPYPQTIIHDAHPNVDINPSDKRTKPNHSLNYSSPNPHSLGTTRGNSAQPDRPQSSSIHLSSKDETHLTNTFPEIRQTTKKKKKPIDEGPLESNRINIGPKYQVPSYPLFFLNRDLNQDQTSVNTKTSFQNHSQQAELVFSPFCLDKIKNQRIHEDEGSKVIKNDQELENFVQSCAKNWRNSAGWHPFSPEFAFKILHHYGYDPIKALESLCDSHFQFSRICDPPTRKYENKWRPKDKRSTRLLNPFPPIINVRGYYSRRQNNLSSTFR